MVARAAKIDDEFVTDADVTQSPEGWEWETKAEAAPTTVIFEKFGETFVGQYVEKRHIDREPSADGKDQSFDLFVFRGRDNELYALNSSYALAEGMEDIEAGQWCRFTYVKDVPTGRNLNPMKSFHIDVRR